MASGTAAGALLGEVIPEVLSSALGIAIYGMFLAIIIPQARDNHKCLVVIIIAAVLSCCFKYIPLLDNVSSGFVIIICAVLASVVRCSIIPCRRNGGRIMPAEKFFIYLAVMAGVTYLIRAFAICIMPE